MTERELIVSEYNKEFLSILKMTSDHFADDAEIEESIKRLRERLILLKSSNHEILLTLAGPYILQYKDMIKKRNLSEFTEEKLNAEIAKLGKEDKSVTIFRYFGFAKKLYDGIEDSERKKLFDKLDTLLRNYLTFCIKYGN